MASIEIIGGTWDSAGGRPSKVIKSLAEGILLSNKFSRVVVNNGGNYISLSKVLECGPASTVSDVIVWMPNISNDLPKLRNIKEIFPKTILVSSKNNVSTKYSFQDIVAHGLALKSNLVLEIRKHGWFTGRLLDTLGNVWYDKRNDFRALGIAIASRSRKLMNVTRQATVHSPEKADPILPFCRNDLNTVELRTREFFKIVKNSAELFHKLIHPAKGITRFLGNASFRCESGFPSIQFGDGRIYMSRRNVDKRFIGPNTFVQVGLNEETDTIWYRGDHKPSVDTAIQVRLYKKLGCICYMMHSHVYEKNAPFTSKMIPCGGLEEVDEVLKVISKNDLPAWDKPYFAINLKGHGSIAFMNNPRDFGRLEFEARPTPEIM